MSALAVGAKATLSDRLAAIAQGLQAKGWQDPANPLADELVTQAVAVAEMAERAAALERNVSAQGSALADLITRWEPLGLTLQVGPFDLPDGYWLVTLRLRTGDFTCGISPAGEISS